MTRQICALDGSRFGSRLAAVSSGVRRRDRAEVFHYLVMTDPCCGVTGRMGQEGGGHVH